MRLGLSALTWIALAAAPATATAMEHRTYATGQMLLRALSAGSAYESGVARGYIGGIADVGAGEPVNGFLFCVPKTATLEQLGQKVRTWLDKHPESRNYSGKGVVGAALADAYPCAGR